MSFIIKALKLSYTKSIISTQKISHKVKMPQPIAKRFLNLDEGLINAKKMTNDLISLMTLKWMKKLLEEFLKIRQKH